MHRNIIVNIADIMRTVIYAGLLYYILPAYGLHIMLL